MTYNGGDFLCEKCGDVDCDLKGSDMAVKVCYNFKGEGENKCIG